jgi:hypothetical protein
VVVKEETVATDDGPMQWKKIDKKKKYARRSMTR